MSSAKYIAPPRLQKITISSADARYEQLRSTYTTSARPAAVILVRDVEDVAAAIISAREQQLPLSIRSGGHGLSGHASNDGGVVVDLSAMAAVTVVDRSSRLIRVEAGARWGDVADTLADDQLAISAGDHGRVGVGGVAVTGGAGLLVRRYGLTIDRVRAAEMVLADGSSIRTSSDHHPDLYWALRGAGAGLGAVTAFEIEAIGVDRVGFAQLTFDIDANGDQLTAWASAVAAAPREVSSIGTLLRHGPSVMLSTTTVVAHNDSDAIRAMLAPLMALRPARAEASVLPYSALLAHPRQANIGQMAAQSTTMVFPELTAQVAQTLLAVAARQGLLIQLRSLGGAVTDIDTAATAFAHRSHTIFAVATLFAPGTLQQLTEMVAPLRALASGSYAGFESGTDPAIFARCYPGDTGAKVASAWSRVDPDAVFRPMQS